ncbi:putative Chymotrypsinogen B [Hypsibius exemplaris]|uniref:Chymotrypsinogen B n=1 Tax=Hypsibius exemplaris TaxID=2072580 RepID=A0A1W0XEN6_HYPEX|nr:putative Chymotrypsinogen B [Hypsibius exemplaris]
MLLIQGTNLVLYVILTTAAFLARSTDGEGKTGANPLLAMGGGLSDSLSSVLDCTFNGKTGLCVPRVLKDIVCVPLGFLFDEDTKTCGIDNVCCHSKVDGSNATTTSTTTTASPIETTTQPPAQDSAASINLLLSKTQAPASNSNNDAPSISKVSPRDRPKPIKIPISLSAYVPGHPSNKPLRRQPVAQRRPVSSMTQTSPPNASSKTAVRMCKVGATQGMCVKNDLVQSLCIPLGFKAIQKDCSPNYMCCYNPGSSSDLDQDESTETPIFVRQVTRRVITEAPAPLIQSPQISTLDIPSSMDTCSPTTGVAGLCIRSDIAPMVCTPLGYEIGSQMSCASDRLCCYSSSGTVPVAPPAVTVAPPLFSNQPGGVSKSCQVGPGITGTCVPSNLVSSCPLFGRKISPYGCATRHLAMTEYCCYETPDLATDRDASVSNFVSVAGSLAVPKLDSIVCGRKGLSGIEPRALRRRTPKLLGAHDTMPGEFCWQAAIFDEEDKPFCNGALIHREWVLTTAHCVKRTPPAKMLIKLGMWSLTNESSAPGQDQSSDYLPRPQSLRVLEAFIHTNFDGITLDNNIALLHLDNFADFTEPQVCLACLPSIRSYEGSTCTVTGFSSPDGNTFGKDSTLSQLDFVLQNSSKCDESLRTNGKLQSNFRLNADVAVCALANANEDTCHGDGGSPLVCQNTEGNYELTGLVSWGLACGIGSPSVFTKVWAFNSWIQEIIRRYSQSYI